jgi:hypothetical protein
MFNIWFELPTVDLIFLKLIFAINLSKLVIFVEIFEIQKLNYALATIIHFGHGAKIEGKIQPEENAKLYSNNLSYPIHYTTF